MRHAPSLSLIDTPGKVSLAYMRDFVRHDRGELGFSVRVERSCCIYANDPARCCECVKLFAVDDDKRKAVIL